MKNIYIDRESRSIADLILNEEEKTALITRINVPEIHRGKGSGSKLLKEICEDADREEFILKLYVSPSGGLSGKELVKWYQRHGFQHRAFFGEMERPPNPQVVSSF